MEVPFGWLMDRPARALFHAMDDRGGGLLYIFPPYESNGHMKRSSKVLALSLGFVILGSLSLLLRPYTDGCFSVSLVIALVLFCAVVLNHRRRPSLKVYSDGIRLAGMDLTTHNFRSVVVSHTIGSPTIDLLHPRGKGQLGWKPCYEFRFLLDLGSRDVGACIELLCKEHEVDAHLLEMRRYIPGMRMYFNKEMPKGTEGTVLNMMWAISDPKEFLKTKLKLP